MSEKACSYHDVLLRQSGVRQRSTVLPLASIRFRICTCVHKLSSGNPGLGGRPPRYALRQNLSLQSTAAQPGHSS